MEFENISVPFKIIHNLKTQILRRRIPKSIKKKQKCEAQLHRLMAPHAHNVTGNAHLMAKPQGIEVKSERFEAKSERIVVPVELFVV